MENTTKKFRPMNRVLVCFLIALTTVIGFSVSSYINYGTLDIFGGTSQEKPEEVLRESIVFQPNVGTVVERDAEQQDGLITEDINADDSITIDTKTEVLDDKWYRNHLSEEEQEIYDVLRQGFVTLADDIDIPDSAPDSVEKCYEYVLNDTPEIFWLGNSYQYIITANQQSILSVQPEYKYSKEEIEKYQIQIQKLRDEIISQIPAEMNNDYDKAKFLYSLIAEVLTYNEDWADNQDLATVFLKNVSACGGYSKIYQYLLRGAGIESLYITGVANANGEEILHAWNALKLDGVVCYADVTWGDKDDKISTDYSWFGLTLDSISINHVPTSLELVPAAPDNRYELWTIQDSYYDIYDEATVFARVLESLDEHQLSLGIRFATQEELDKAYDQLRTSTRLATQAVMNHREVFNDPEDGIYKIYKVPGLNACVIEWKYADQQIGGDQTFGSNSPSNSSNRTI